MDESIRFVQKYRAFSLDPWDPLSENGKKVLEYLLEKKEENIYIMTKELKEYYTNIEKAVNTLLSRGLIEIGRQRPQRKNREEMTDQYRLTEKGINALIYPYYQSNYSGKQKTRIKNLTHIFNILRNRCDTPFCFPDIFRMLPDEYSVVFYPFFYQWCSEKPSEVESLQFLLKNPISDIFRTLLEVKNKYQEKTKFVVANEYFECEIPITEKERELMLEYLKV